MFITHLHGWVHRRYALEPRENHGWDSAFGSLEVRQCRYLEKELRFRCKAVLNLKSYLCIRTILIIVRAFRISSFHLIILVIELLTYFCCELKPYSKQLQHKSNYVIIRLNYCWLFKMDIMSCTNWKEKHNINTCLLTQSN